LKKPIIARITVIACVVLCAAVWPRSAEVGDLSAVNAEIEARAEGTPQTLFSAVTLAPKIETVAETEPEETEIATEKETQKPVAPQTTQSVKPTPAPSEPNNGYVRIVNGEKANLHPRLRLD